MSKPAARIGDMHTCPAVTLPAIPHVGGPVTGPGCASVLIGGKPAAALGDNCSCRGAVDTIVMGSAGVFFENKPAARAGDHCVHGGIISGGDASVLIGDGGKFPAAASAAMLNAKKQLPAKMQHKMAQVVTLKQAAVNGKPFAHVSKACPHCCGKL